MCYVLVLSCWIVNLESCSIGRPGHSSSDTEQRNGPMVSFCPYQFCQSHHEDKDFTTQIPWISSSVRKDLNADIPLYGNVQDAQIESNLLCNSQQGGIK